MAEGLTDPSSSDDQEPLRAVAEQLGGMEELLQAILAVSDSIIFVKDREGRYVLVNPAFARSFGRPAEEIVGRDDSDLFPNGEASSLREIDRRVLAGETVRTKDTLTIDGKVRIFAATKLPLKDRGGRIIGVGGFAREITEQEDLADTLRDRERLLSTVFDSVQDGISVLNPDLTIRYVNAKMNEWYADNVPLEGKKCYACYRNRSEPCDPCPTLRALRSGAIEMEVAPGPPGSPVEWVELFSYPMKDPSSGEITGVVEFIRDITDKVKDELRSQHLTSVLRAIRNVNQLITKEVDRDRLLQSACDALVANRGYRHAYITLFSDGTMNGFYHAGTSNGMNPLAERLNEGGIPACIDRALTEEGVVLIDDPAEECEGCPLPDDPSRYRELAVRLEHSGTVYGVLMVSLPKEHAGVDEEQRLLEEVAGDIAFALHDLLAEENRRLTHAALKESEERYRLIVENSHSGIVIIDEAYRLTYANDEFCRIIGRSREEIIGHDFREFLHEESRELVVDRYRRRQAGEDVPPRYEFSVLRADGTKRWVEISSTVIHDPNGGVRTLAQILDITERKVLEERLQAIYALGRSLILKRDRRSIARRIVEAAKRLIGIEDCVIYLLDKERNVLSLAAYTIPVPKEYEEFRLDSETGIIPEVARSKEAIYIPDTSAEPRFISGTGETQSELCLPLLIEDRLIGVLNAESPQIDGFSPADRHLLTTLATAGAVALENFRLREETAKLRGLNERIVTTLNEGIVLENEQERITYVNPAAARMLGYSAEELIGRKWSVLIPEEERSAIAAKMSARRAGVSDRYETNLLTKTGERFPVILSASPMMEGGRYAGTISAFTDITKRVNAENSLMASLNKTRRTLDSVIKALEATIDLRDPYTAGHQIRVAQLAVAIGKEMDLSEEKIDAIRYASLVHDIGKLAVPSEILSRPSKLSNIEFAIIKEHPAQAHSILKGIDFPWPIDEIVLQHHERLDGSGYPKGLKGGEIMPEARILAVADVVEAMASHRPYRPALGIREALIEIVRNKGRLYDPDVVDACLSAFENGFSFE